MLSSSTEELWNEFLEKYEPEFKAYLGYGKDEIKRIGIDSFFKAIGWTKPEQLSSFKTDRMHIIPCIECGKEFAVFEDNYGLCDKCKDKYDLEEFSNFYRKILESDGVKAGNDLISGFFASPDYRKTFAVKSDSTPEYALIKKGSGAWRLFPLESLLSLLRSGDNYTYQIILHDQSLYSKDGKTEFSDIDTAEELSKEFPAFFSFSKTDMV